MRTILVGLLCLVAAGALAHPPERIEWHSFVEGFSEGVDHPELVTAEQGVSFAGGEVVFAESGLIEISDPAQLGFAAGVSPNLGFCDLAIHIVDDLVAAGDWEIAFEGPTADVAPGNPSVLRITASGTTLTIRYANTWIDESVSIARNDGPFVFRAGSFYRSPTIERFGAEESLFGLQGIEFLPSRIEMSGSRFRVDQIVITPWLYSVGTEQRSWGEVKAGF